MFKARAKKPVIFYYVGISGHGPRSGKMLGLFVSIHTPRLWKNPDPMAETANRWKKNAAGGDVYSSRSDRCRSGSGRPKVGARSLSVVNNGHWQYRPGTKSRKHLVS